MDIKIRNKFIEIKNSIFKVLTEISDYFFVLKKNHKMYM